MRPAWWVAIGAAVVAIAAFGHPPASPNPSQGQVVPGISIDQLPRTEVPAQITLRSLAIEGAGDRTSAVVGNGGAVLLSAGYAVRSSAESPQIVARLERKLGTGAWEPTGVRATTSSGEPLTMRTPAYSTSGVVETVQYRFASDTSASQPIAVVYENQQRYTGVAATIYGYAAPYCPSTAVHIADLPEREAGDYRTGALLIRVDYAVGATAESTPADQRSIAIHECSHELQWLNYGGTSAGRERMETAAAGLFAAGSNGAAPIEHAADCGAKAVSSDSYLGYGGECTPTEIAAAGRLLAGQRY